MAVIKLNKNKYFLVYFLAINKVSDWAFKLSHFTTLPLCHFLTCLLAFLLITSVSISVPAFAETLTLQQCYDLALKQNEPIKIQIEKIIQAEQKYKQAFGAILPRFSFYASDFFQDTSKATSDSASSVGSTFTRGERPEIKFVLRQALFSGFREFSTMSSLTHEKQKEKLSESRLKYLLYIDVAKAFYLVRQIEKNLENVQAIVKITRERISELRQRVELGKSRESEVLSAESQLSLLLSEEEQLKGQIRIARELLSLFTGQELGGAVLSDTMPEVENIEEENIYVKKVILRSDIKALQEDVLSKEFKLKTAKGALLPVANLTGNYYLKRVGFQEGINWDLLLALDIPIFQAGVARSQIVEANSQLASSRHQLELLRRQSENEISNAYHSLKSSIEQTKILKNAYDAAKKSYELQVNEYRLGLVNNLDVLQSI
ncbi:MAG: TolC family protein, partial [Elusimicrobiota bacterium]